MLSSKNQNISSLSNNAYLIIKDMIVNGELVEGSVISISAISQELNMSRTPVTIACQRLESDKFLTIIPKQGVLINSMTIDEAREVHELRAAIESYSAKCSFDSFNDSDIEFLKSSLEKQQAYVDSKDVKAFMTEDLIFHKYILNKYNNAKFISIIDNLYDRVFLTGIKNCSVPSRLVDSMNEHKAIVEALQKYDKLLFIDAVESHVINGYISLTGNYKYNS